METKDQIDIVLKEYDALRKDIEDRSNTPKLFFVPLLIASLAGFFGWKAEASVDLILLFALPLLLIILSFALNADFYVLRTARQVAKIEDKIFRLSGLSLLTHETEILHSRRQFHARKAFLVGASVCIFYFVIEAGLFSGLWVQLAAYPIRIAILIFILLIPPSMFVVAGVRLLLVHKANLNFRSQLLDKLLSNNFDYLADNRQPEIADGGSSRLSSASSEPPQRHGMNSHSQIPNIITSFRLALLVPFVWLARAGSGRSYIAAAVVLSIATLTDLLDGYLARRLNSVSVLGDLLDVLADRLLAVVSVVLLLVTGTANFYLGLAVVCRELTADCIRTLATRSGAPLPHNIFGQVKLVAIVAAAVVGLLTLAGVTSSVTGRYLADASLVVAVATGMLSIVLMLRSYKVRS